MDAAEFGKVGVGHHCIEGVGWRSGRHSFRCTNAVGREWKTHYFKYWGLGFEPWHIPIWQEILERNLGKKLDQEGVKI